MLLHHGQGADTTEPPATGTERVLKNQAKSLTDPLLKLPETSLAPRRPPRIWPFQGGDFAGGPGFPKPIIFRDKPCPSHHRGIPP